MTSPAAQSGTDRVVRPVITAPMHAGCKLVWFWNSWGTQWGLGGRFCMTFDTWDQLLHEQGDVTVPLT